MAGLFDFGDAPPVNLSPGMMGLLGMASQVGQAYAPQAASRLPLAKPNAAYLLSQAAGGFGQGYGAGLQQQGQQAQTQGQQIKNLNDALSYNLWAPYLGQQPISMGQPGGMGAGAAPPMQMPSPGAAAGPGMGAGSPGVQVAQNGGGAPAASGGAPGGAPDMTTLLTTMPPPLLQRMGIQVPPELTAAFYAGVKPGTPEWQNIVRSVAIKSSGVNPVIGGDRAGVPAQSYDLGTGTYKAMPGQLGPNGTMAQGGFASEYGRSQGGLPAEFSKIAAQGEQARLTQGNAATLSTGIPNAGIEAGPKIVPLPAAKGQMPEGNAIQTTKGTLVPVAPKPTDQLGVGTDEISKSNERSGTILSGWNAVRPTIESQTSNLESLSNAFRDVQAGGLTIGRAEASNVLQAMGLKNAAAQVMTAPNVASVQTALWTGMQDVLRNLKVINTGTGGRILASEFQAMSEHAFNPDMQPQALFNAVTSQLGQMYQIKNMIDDWDTGKAAGWRSAEGYQTAYLKANPIKNFTDYAENATAPFKGMPGNNQSAGPTPALPDYEAEMRKRGLLK